ncbi:MAG: hypothetical protein Q8L48_22505 [Archangium sp.]|nr:hypothetical protein [Archangium sp.]
MRDRWLWLCTTFLLTISGCQCFVPVDEPDGSVDAGLSCARAADCPGAEPVCEPFVCGQCRACRASACQLESQICPTPDGGTDAGVDAGTDAGQPAGDGGCMRAAQCTGVPQPTSTWCSSGSSRDAGFSCIANTCLWECPLTSAGRTCIVDMGSYCLRCGGDAGTTCPLSGTCPGGPSTTQTAMVEAGSTCTTWPGTTTPFTDVSIMRTASAQCRYAMSGANQLLGDFWRMDDGTYLAFFPGFGGWCTGRSAITGAPRSIFSCPSCQFVLMGFE